MTEIINNILKGQGIEDLLPLIVDGTENLYPLIMKQQTINDQVIKDVFGVSGSDLQEIRSEIAMLQKGELIQKDNLMAAMGLGKSWKKVKVTHLI